MNVLLGAGTALRVKNVSKTFPADGGGVEALRDVSFVVSEGAFFSVVGPSGCGKSTLLGLIAGLDQPDSGEIELGAESQEPSDRLGRVAYMPQKDLLLPWRSALDNASLGLELTGVPRLDARERAMELMKRFGLGTFADAYPAVLSGGMRQRVAFLRTLLTDRMLMLLDEPFASLDALTRRTMQEWLLDVWSEFRRTVVLITHDVEEAVFLSDRVAVMSHRPGGIVYERDVGLDRPRSPDLVTAPEFVEIKRDLLERLGATREGMHDASD